MCVRNSATETVEQELLFVGQESGKLLAMRNMVKKVGIKYNTSACVCARARACVQMCVRVHMCALVLF